MSYWSHHPELYDEICFNEMVRQGLATEDEDMEEALDRLRKMPDGFLIMHFILH